MERRSLIKNAAIFSAAFAAAPLVEAALTETPKPTRLPTYTYQVRRACHVFRMQPAHFSAEEFKGFLCVFAKNLRLFKAYSDPRATLDCAVYLDVPHYTALLQDKQPKVELEPGGQWKLDSPLRWVVVPTQSEFKFRGVEFRFWDRDLFEPRYLEPDFFL